MNVTDQLRFAGHGVNRNNHCMDSDEDDGICTK